MYSRQEGENKPHYGANTAGMTLLSVCIVQHQSVCVCAYVCAHECMRVCLLMLQPCWWNGMRQAIAHVIFNCVSPWKPAYMHGGGNLLLC